MELRQYFNLFRKWIWLIVLCTVIAGATAFLVSRQQIPIYQAEATVLINQGSATGNSNYQDILMSERIAQTYANLLQDWPILERTLKQLGFEGDYKVLAKAFQIDVTVTSIRSTQLVSLKVEASDPEVAAHIANTLPEVFMDTTKEQQGERFNATRQDIQTELSKLEGDIAAVQEDIAARQDTGNQTELTRLQNTLDRYETTYAGLLNSLEQLRLTEVQSTDNIVLTAPARTPKDPIRPRTLMNALLAAIVGAMLALGAAFLIEYLDDTVKTPDDIREISGLPTLGAVIALEETTPQERLVPLHSPRSPAAEAYRVLRTNLQFSSLDKPITRLLITSPGPGEGKSTTAANLATVIAQTGKNVILLDADLRRPNVHRLFQLPNNTGMTTTLLDSKQDVSRYLQATSVKGLQVMTTGPIPPNPAEMLGSARMKELLDLLQSQADMVIVDSPPVLAVADAAILSSEVDGSLLVVASGETRADMLLSSLERLDSVGSRPLGIVLNKLTERKSGYYYYYYYHYASRYNEDGGDEGRGKGPGFGNGRTRRSRQKQPDATSTRPVLTRLFSWLR